MSGQRTPNLRHLNVVLVRPRTPENVGTAARAIANHGLGKLVVVSPVGFDPCRARWTASGAREVVNDALFVQTVSEAVADRKLVVGTTGRKRKWHWPLWSISELAEKTASKHIPTAVLFGPEDTGLHNEDLAWCHALMTFPTTDHASVNLGQAVTVVAAALMAHSCRQDSAPQQAETNSATVARMDQVLHEALSLLNGTPYMGRQSPNRVRSTLYQILGRATPTEQELSILLGMLNAVRKKTSDTKP